MELNQPILFNTFLQTAFDNGQYATDDIIAFLLPLFQEVNGFHEGNLVAPFHLPDTLFITQQQLDITESKARPILQNIGRINQLLEQQRANHFVITEQVKVTTDVNIGHHQVEDQQIQTDLSIPIQQPVYLPGYSCFEIIEHHHDPLTDIFCLGLVLGSMALGLNLNDEDDLALFVSYRSNPVQFNHRIHPTISGLITGMTELDRQKRMDNLYEIIEQLQHYRDFDPEKAADLSQTPGWINKDLSQRHQLILQKLRNRLFDTSRRNRLLYYKPNMRFVNLTVSSVPNVLHYQSIQPALLFTWNKEIASHVTGSKDMVLNRYLRFEDHTYLPAALDKIRVESQRDQQEFGFSQLRMVVAFLNWHNLKEDANERIQSPLLLIPVELKKTKRLKEDHYLLKILNNEAEVNPVLANQLRELYGIQLPDFVDLETMKMEAFYQALKHQIDAAKQGIQLQYIDKPRIRLVHNIAKQTVNTYNRRLRKTNIGGSYKNTAYSYQQDNYQPLGLALFKQLVQPMAAHLEFLINDDIQIKSQQLIDHTEREKKLYQLVEGESNPYSWEFDCCNMVLGNFNYKKMSLVRDYNQIIDQQMQHDVFEQLFSTHPKPIEQPAVPLDQPADWHHVITADPTQTNAILQSRTGKSYIIQGPPGTGKSQTITNLIADFAALGKTVLFVCEKRAALDVVFHRLKQNNLDELCCYIHDSQGDKRSFIKDLKTTYEHFSRDTSDLAAIQQQRAKLVTQMDAQLQLLQQFHVTNAEVNTDAGIPIRQLYNRLIQLKDSGVQLTPHQNESIPLYKYWLEFGTTVQALSKSLEESGSDATFAKHPFSHIKSDVLLNEQPLNLLDSLLQHSKTIVQEIQQVITDASIDPAFSNTLNQIKNLVLDAVLLQPLAEHNNLQLVNSNNGAAKKFDKQVQQYRKQKTVVEKAKQTNQHWTNKFSEQDVQQAIQIAQKQEPSFFKFLSSSWRKLKQQINNSYQFGAHAVKPSYTQVLQQLKDEYDALQQLNQAKDNIAAQYHLDNIDTTYLGIEVLRNKVGDQEIDYLLAHPNANELVKKLQALNNKLHQLEMNLQQCIHDFAVKPVSELEDELDTIGYNINQLPDLLPALREFIQLPNSLQQTIRKIPLTPAQAEAVMAQKTITQLYQQNRAFAGIDCAAIEKAVDQLQSSYQQLLQLNAQQIRAAVRQQFLQHVELSNTALSQLNAEQKQFKKQYFEGRKIIENEFGKSMRFKSIRELSGKESGRVLKDLKPIWLMSPLSVSDSLPLDPDFFDVVIFDEASQITLEEGIPALYRSCQTIIVGDDKQMPPTNFFATKQEDPDDLSSVDPDEDPVLLSIDADSLLVQGARKLNSTMLSWHYRSRYETLISYSNHAFYEAGLLTIPDKTIHHGERLPITVSNPEDAAQFAETLFDRSISFHHLTNSTYENRSNQQEANYIAQLVKNLLAKNTQESIGIVAFSQEQQHAIEDALTHLAMADPMFEQQLEEAYNRTENDQFIGLIVKNLENIQGDERDIIIMSVCYGFDARKKLLMNFGPINKKGGEKRLNVIFSRAKQHMAIVSSIQYHHITNEYNEGANYFRRFLQYAEQVSNGQMQNARTVLDGLVAHTSNKTTIATSTIVAQQLSQQLQSKGYQVALQVGQSNFKCSVAIKKNASDEQYTMAVLIDDELHYANNNLLEQYFQRPAILQSFGWKCMHLFAKDWLEQPDRMVELILKRLHTTSVPAAANTPAPDFIHSDSIEPVNVAKPIQPPGMENYVFERLEINENNSSRFWEVAVYQNKLVARYGKTGTRGQMIVKSYPDHEKALVEKQKQWQEKLDKGYQPNQ